MFDGILKCKGRADATRNALNILQSHRVLFNLPRSIERNIKAVRTVLFLMVVHSLNLPLSLSLSLLGWLWPCDLWLWEGQGSHGQHSCEHLQASSWGGTAPDKKLSWGAESPAAGATSHTRWAKETHQVRNELLCVHFLILLVHVAMEIL